MSKPDTSSRQRVLPGPQDTEALGAALARALSDAAQPLVLFLEGDLGAGKTCFARGLLRQLGVTGTIRSPSYALLEQYEAQGWRVLHLDLYRLIDPGEIEHLGVRDLHVGRTLWLVEWPDKGVGYLPEPDVVLRFAAGTTAHRFDASGASAEGLALLDRLDREAGS